MPISADQAKAQALYREGWRALGEVVPRETHHRVRALLSTMLPPKADAGTTWPESEVAAKLREIETALVPVVGPKVQVKTIILDDGMVLPLGRLKARAPS